MRKSRITTVAAFTILLLAGCGTSQLSGEATGQNTTPPASSGSAPPTSSESPPTTTEPQAVPETLRFGQTWLWEDGMQVTVSSPRTFHPSESAAGTENFSHFVVFTVTVKNGGSKKVDLMGMASVSSRETEGSELFDTEHGVEGAPSTALLPGRTVTYKVAFGVEDPADIVFQYAPTFEHEDAIFTTK